jgi:heptosyltransferase I
VSDRVAARARPPAHVCIVMLTGLGDVVHALPVANALKRAWPHTRISWVVEPMPSAILSPHPAIDNVIVYEKKKGWRGVRDLRRRMRRESFDITLNLHPYFKSIWGTLFSRAPERWTFGPDRARDLVWLAGNRRLPQRPRRHTADMFLEFVEVLGLDPYPVEWNFAITPDERSEQQQFSERLEGRPAVGVALASANASKDWPAERYIPVIDAIEHDFGARAVLLGGLSHREQHSARVIADGVSKQPLSMLGWSVRSLVWSLEACTAAVAPDTGPLHIARAVGTPVVGMYGRTDPRFVGPFHAFEDLVIDTFVPPDADGRYRHEDGMLRIQPEEVIAKLELALRHPRASAPARPGQAEHAG